MTPNELVVVDYHFNFWQLEIPTRLAGEFTTDNNAFEMTLAGVRNGDSEVVDRFIRTYQPIVEEYAKDLGVDGKLPNQYGRSDVVQSVLVQSLDVVRREYPIAGPEGFLGLLRVITRNKWKSLVRKQIRRGVAPVSLENLTDDSCQLSDLAMDPGKSPSEIVTDRELADVALMLMDPACRDIWHQRCQGKTWKEIGETVNKRPHTMEVKFARELDRISRVLFPDETGTSSDSG